MKKRLILLLTVKRQWNIRNVKDNDVSVQETDLTIEPNSFLSKNILQVMTAIQQSCVTLKPAWTIVGVVTVWDVLNILRGGVLKKLGQVGRSDRHPPWISFWSPNEYSLKVSRFNPLGKRFTLIPPDYVYWGLFINFQQLWLRKNMTLRFPSLPGSLMQCLLTVLSSEDQ